MLPTKFWIKLFQVPNQVYYPGSVVAGGILLEVDESQSYKRVLVKFCGRSSVLWTVSDNESSTDISSLEPYFDKTAPLWDSQQSPDGKLPPGEYEWPFSFTIPPSVPSSFEGNSGNIRYTVVGKIVSGLAEAQL